MTKPIDLEVFDAIAILNGMIDGKDDDLAKSLKQVRDVIIRLHPLQPPKPLKPSYQNIITMLGGHIVEAEVIDIKSDGSFRCKFLCHYETGSERLWLDLGANWKIAKGEEFIAHQINIDQAADNLKRYNVMKRTNAKKAGVL